MAFDFIISKASKSLFKGLYFSIMALGAISMPCDVQAQESQYSDKELCNKFGYHLTHHFWSDVKHKNVKAYSKQIASQFKGLNISGDYDKRDQITGLENLSLTDFSLENLKISRYATTLVVTYDFHAEGEGVTSGPSIDVWNLKDNSWKLVSHSYAPFADEELDVKCGCGWKRKNKDRQRR